MRLIDKKRAQIKTKIEDLGVDIDELTEDLTVDGLEEGDRNRLNYMIHSKKTEVHSLEQKLEDLDIIELTAELYL